MTLGLETSKPLNLHSSFLLHALGPLVSLSFVFWRSDCICSQKFQNFVVYWLYFFIFKEIFNLLKILVLFCYCVWFVVGGYKCMLSLCTIRNHLYEKNLTKVKLFPPTLGETLQFKSLFGLQYRALQIGAWYIVYHNQSWSANIFLSLIVRQ